jgi:hypothetical protein
VSKANSRSSPGLDFCPYSAGSSWLVTHWTNTKLVDGVLDFGLFFFSIFPYIFHVLFDCILLSFSVSFSFSFLAQHCILFLFSMFIFF